MAGGVDHHPDPGLRLVLGQPCPGRDGVGDRRVEVVDLDLEVDHLVLLTGLLGPHRGAVPLLSLDQQVGAAGRIAQRDPAVAVASRLFVSEEAAIEAGQLLGVGAVDAHARPPQRRPAESRSVRHASPLASSATDGPVSGTM